MRLGVLVSLFVHAGAVATVWLLWEPAPDEPAGYPDAYLDVATVAAPEPTLAPPPEPTAAPAPVETESLPPLEEAAEPLDVVAEPPFDAPQAFQLRPVTPLDRPLPVRRRRVPAAAPAVPARPAPAAPAPRKGATAGRLVPPRIAKAPPARYPARARRMGLEGRVVLTVHVAARGTVDKAEVAKSSGHDSLDRAALEAARGWTFHPAKRDGRPIAHVVRIPVDFSLRG